MLPAHNLSKVCFLNAYGFLHIFNIVILLETYLDSNVLSEDANLEVQGYELIRTDFLSNFKRGGFCIYYTEEATEMAAKYLRNKKMCFQ